MHKLRVEAPTPGSYVLEPSPPLGGGQFYGSDSTRDSEDPHLSGPRPGYDLDRRSPPLPLASFNASLSLRPTTNIAPYRCAQPRPSRLAVQDRHSSTGSPRQVCMHWHSRLSRSGRNRDARVPPQLAAVSHSITSALEHEQPHFMSNLLTSLRPGHGFATETRKPSEKA